MVYTFNQEPSRDINYSSLYIDEQRRGEKAVSFPHAERFTKKVINGDLSTVVEGINNAELRKEMPRIYQVNTCTRTVFKDSLYESQEPIPDFLQESPTLFSSIKSPPHVPLNQFAPKDTRIRKLKPNYKVLLGPGSYETDPLGEKATGPLRLPSPPKGTSGSGGGSNNSGGHEGGTTDNLSPGKDAHSQTTFALLHGHVRSGSLARDPSRPSQCFVSPIRGASQREAAMRQSSTPPLGLDFATWTSKGCYRARNPRDIATERWGVNNRERKPAVEDRMQKFYDTTVTSSGSPSSCVAAVESSAVAYRNAFASTLPRMVPLPQGKGDTRFPGRGHEDFPGPGQYRTDTLRLRSQHAALLGAEPYFTHGSAEGSTWGNGNRSSHLSQSLPLGSVLPSSSDPLLPAAGSGSGIPKFGDARNALSAPNSPGGSSGGGPRQRFRSKEVEAAVATTSSGAPFGAAANVGEFEKLMFMKRATPHAAFVRSRLQVSKELNSERERQRKQLTG